MPTMYCTIAVEKTGVSMQQYLSFLILADRDRAGSEGDHTFQHMRRTVVVGTIGVRCVFDAVVLQLARRTAAHATDAAALAVALQYFTQGLTDLGSRLQRDAQFFRRIGFQVQRARVALLAGVKKLAHFDKSRMAFGGLVGNFHKR